MEHASNHVGCYSSDEDDYVNMDEDEMVQGIQSVSDSVQPLSAFSINNNQNNNNNNNNNNGHALNPLPPPMVPINTESAPAIHYNNNNNNNNNINKIPMPMMAPIPSSVPYNPPNQHYYHQHSPHQHSPHQHSHHYAHSNQSNLSHHSPPSLHHHSHINNINNNNNQNKSLHTKLQSLRFKKKKKNIIKRKKVNANVVSLDLSTLGKESEKIFTGDPYFCSNKNCKVILSNFDKLIPIEEDKDQKNNDMDANKVWNCQFCGTKNKIDIETEEIPNESTIDYMIAPAINNESKNEETNQVLNESVVVFCIDISGSMCVSQEIAGKYNLRGSQLESMRSSFKEFHDGSNQYFDNQKRNTTWISRLQCVQAGIENQLKELKTNFPNNKVCLVTFSNDVQIIGDGLIEPVFIAGDKLNDMNQLKQIGSNIKLNKSIQETSKVLIDKLYELQENGQTALGPALVASIAIASQKPGSKIILCTDGCANLGVGNLDAINDNNNNNDNNNDNDNDNEEELDDEITKFYENLGNYALTNGVTVNVISITDDQCQCEYIGKVCDISQGSVEKINPLNIVENFAGILNRITLATNVSCSYFLHPALKFKAEEEDDNNSNNNNDDNDNNNNKKNKNNKNKNIIHRTEDIGNVFEDSKVFFEYEVLKHKIGKLTHIPFQCQISFKRLDGARMIRVITQLKEITKDRKKVLNHLNMSIIGANASRKSAQLAENGDYENARINTYSHAMWMNSNNDDNNVYYKHNTVSMNNYVSNNLKLDNLMQQQQIMDQSSNISFKSKLHKKKARKSKRNDTF